MGESKRRKTTAETIYERQPLEHRLGDDPIETAYHQKMTAITQALDKTFNGDAHGPDRKTGFVLMVFPMGGTGRCNCMSNGVDRQDIIVLMKEMIARFEGQPKPSGGRA